MCSKSGAPTDENLRRKTVGCEDQVKETALPPLVFEWRARGFESDVGVAATKVFQLDRAVRRLRGPMLTGDLPGQLGLAPSAFDPMTMHKGEAPIVASRLRRCARAANDGANRY